MAVGTFLPPVVAEILAKTDQFQAEMLKARGEMSATAESGTSSFGKLASVGKTATLALGAAAIGVAVESVKLADDFEGANARLDTAIHNSGSNVDQWASQISGAESKLEHFGFTNTETESSLATLTNATHNEGTALSLMGLDADVARGRHIDLASATGILTKVETGHVALLGKLGINIKDATGATISQEEAIKRLTALYGGNASAYTATFSGKMQTLEATATDLGTKIGIWLVPKLEDVGVAAADAVGWLDRNRVAADALAVVIGGPLAVAIGAFLVLKVESALEGIASAWTLVTGASGRAAAAQAADAATTSAAMTEAATAPAAVAASVEAAVTEETSVVLEQLSMLAAGSEAIVAEAAASAQVQLGLFAAEVGTLTDEETAAAAAATADALATMTMSAADQELAASAAAAASAEAAKAAAESAAAATGALDAAGTGAAGIGEAAGGLGGAVGGISLLGGVAAIAAIPLGAIAFTLHDSSEQAKHAKADVADYLSTVTKGAQSAADPVQYLGDQQKSLGDKIADTQAAIADAKEKAANRGVAANDFEQRENQSNLDKLTRQLGIEKTEYSDLSDSRKKSDDKTTADHAAAVQQQSAATQKALAKEKTDVAAHLAWLGSQYGALDAAMLKSEGLSSTALKSIEADLAQSTTAVAGAIGGFDDVVGKFGDSSKVSSSDISKFLSGQVTDAQHWATNMKTLAHDGLDQGLLEELYKAGPKSAGLVQGLLDSVKNGSVASVNATIAAGRQVEIDAGKNLAGIIVYGEKTWGSLQNYFASHPATATLTIKTVYEVPGDPLSGKFINPNTKHTVHPGDLDTSGPDTGAAANAVELQAKATSGLTAALADQSYALKNAGKDSAAYVVATAAVKEKEDAFRDSLLDSASTQTGPVKKAILDYLTNIGLIPPVKATTVSQPGIAAAITNADRLHHDYDSLNTSVSTQINVLMSAASKGNLDAVRQLLDVAPGSVSLEAKIGKAFAAGGDAAAGTVALVGEHGPEIVEFGQAAHVYPHGTGPDRAATTALNAPQQTSVASTTSFSTPGLTEALSAVERYQTLLAGVPTGIATSVTADTSPAAAALSTLPDAHTTSIAVAGLSAAVTALSAYKGDLQQIPVAVFDPGTGDAQGFHYGTSLGSGVVRGITTTFNSNDVSSFVEARLTNPILAAIIAEADLFKKLQGVVTAGQKDVENHYGSTLQQLPIFDPSVGDTQGFHYGTALAGGLDRGVLPVFQELAAGKVVTVTADTGRAASAIAAIEVPDDKRVDVTLTGLAATTAGLGDLSGRLANIPAHAATEVTVSGVDVAASQLRDYSGEYTKLPTAAHTTVTADTSRALAAIAAASKPITLPLNVERPSLAPASASSPGSPNASAAPPTVKVEQTNHFYGSETPTKTDLDYAGRAVGHRVANLVGRR